MSGRFGTMARDDRFSDRLRRISTLLHDLIRPDQTSRMFGMRHPQRDDQDIQRVEEIAALSNDPSNRGMSKVHELAQLLLYSYIHDEPEHKRTLLRDITTAVSSVHETDVHSAAEQMKRSLW